MVYVPPRSRHQPAPVQTVAPLASRPPVAPVARQTAAPKPVAAKPPKPKKQSNFVEGKIVRRDREKSGRLIDRVDLDEVIGLDYEPDSRQIHASLFGGRHA